MATKDDVKQALWHYQNLYQDTNLLVAFCGQMQVPLMDGFRSVTEKIAELEKQLAQMEEKD